MNSRNMKTVSCLAAAVMALAGAGALPAGTFESLDIKASAATVVASGSCGVNCTYTLDSSGTLTISGSGAMRDYRSSGGTDSSLNEAPWYEMRTAVRKIVIGSGLTTVGNCAFHDLTELTEVTIPSTVTWIGGNAFGYCEKLATISIPASVTYFGNRAFIETAWLKNKQKLDPMVVVNNILVNGSTASGLAVIPDEVTAISVSAFEYAANISDVVIPSSVTKIGSYAFINCGSLKRIFIPSTVTEVGHRSFGYYRADGAEKLYTDVSIYCYAGSAAEKYAKENNIRCVLMESSGTTPGNVNGDDAVNNEDLSLMQQKLAGWNIQNFNEKGADVNGDGVFSSEDISLFQQKLAGWNVQFK